MEKNSNLESYAYNQLLQVVIHEQMLFVSLKTSLVFMNQWHLNKLIFFTIQHKNKVFNNIRVAICDPLQMDLLI